MKNNKPFISIKIVSKDGETKKVGSKKRRRVFNFIKANDFQNCTVKVSVRYGPGFYNKGTYQNKQDLIHALKTFLE